MFIILMGVSGCGKTTIGKQAADYFGVPYYEGDSFHSQENVEKMSQGIPLTDEDREGWLDTLSKLIQDRLDVGESGVLACSALKQKYRDRLCVDHELVRFVYLKGSFGLIQSRLAGRSGHYMPSGLFASQFDALEEPEDAFIIQIDQSIEGILGEVVSCLTQIGFAHK